MNSGLLNIWREIGAYLRYGDAKCAFILGISFSLLFSFVRFKLINFSLSWDFLARLSHSNIDTFNWITIGAFGTALIISTCAVIPSLSKDMTRVNIFIGVGSFFRKEEKKTKERSVIYFVDISKFESAVEYEYSINHIVSGSKIFNEAEKELVEQIWIISRIATSKFVAANISIILIIIGSFFAFL